VQSQHAAPLQIDSHTVQHVHLADGPSQVLTHCHTYLHKVHPALPNVTLSDCLQLTFKLGSG
jgi:hypothetical protein